MINIETVLILGAGASVPFGFPTGQKLTDIICQMAKTPSFAPSTKIENQFIDGMNRTFALLKRTFERRKIIEFADNLLHSGESSVDAFLEYQNDEEIIEIGKAAIVAALLPCENTNVLFEYFSQMRLVNHNKKRIYGVANENNWYQLLWQQLNASFEDFEKNKLSVITFNYDRSLELYLYKVLKSKFTGKKEEEYLNKINSIPIVHVHGKLGLLPWEINNQAYKHVPYGAFSIRDDKLGDDFEREKIREIWFELASHGIKIIHEDVEETEEFKKAHDIISKANQLFFLGFGFHPKNILRLKPEILVKPMKIRGTTFGLQYGRIREIENLSLRNLSRHNYNLVDKKIFDFLYNDVYFNEL